jgi:hypothetical protein
MEGSSVGAWVWRALPDPLPLIQRSHTTTTTTTKEKRKSLGKIPHHDWPARKRMHRGFIFFFCDLFSLSRSPVSDEGVSLKEAKHSCEVSVGANPIPSGVWSEGQPWGYTHAYYTSPRWMHRRGPSGMAACHGHWQPPPQRWGGWLVLCWFSCSLGGNWHSKTRESLAAGSVGGQYISKGHDKHQ